MNDERRDHILDVLLALGRGEVTTYGDVAEVAGHPRQARLVGHILATTEVDVPWWRVVASSGRLRSTDPGEQAALLRDEGVTVVDGRVRAAPVGRFRGPAQASPTTRITEDPSGSHKERSDPSDRVLSPDSQNSPPSP